MDEAERVYKVEGATDMAFGQGIHSDEYQKKHLVITNACGCMSTKAAKWIASKCSDKEFIIIHDADEPGQAGAQRWLKAMAGKCKSLKNVQLPYPIATSHGKDLRDCSASPAESTRICLSLLKQRHRHRTFLSQRLKQPNMLNHQPRLRTQFRTIASSPTRKATFRRDHSPIQEITNALLKQTDGCQSMSGRFVREVCQRTALPSKVSGSFRMDWATTNCPPDFSRQSGLHSKDELMSHVLMSQSSMSRLKASRTNHECRTCST